MEFTNEPLVVRLFFNRGRIGFSERIPIFENKWEFALPIARAIVQAARNIMCAGYVLEWATLAEAEFPWREVALLDAPLLPLPQWGAVGADTAGVWWVFSDLQGHEQGRLFRAIDYSLILDKKFLLMPMVLPAGIPPLPADLTTATKYQLFENAMCVYRDYGCISRRKGPRVDGVQTFMTNRFEEAHFKRVSSRRVGSDYQRQSWEAVPWIAAPPFSPCGMVTGVGRTCFVVQCRFYPLGPVGIIHYYWAKPGAAVFPLPHIFWGRFRDEDLYNSFGVGELTGNARRWWHPGNEFGNAPGLEHEGPIEGFAGQYRPTWSPTYPTPAGLRPACDDPATKNRLVNYGCFCVGGAGIAATKVA